MTRQAALPSTLPPRLISREAAAAYACIGTTTFDAMVKDGRMPKPRLLTDRRRAWDVRELDAAIDNLPRDGENEVVADDGSWSDLDGR